MDAIARYLKAMHDVKSTGGGTPETSYYSALTNLMNDIGSELRPVVMCISQVADTGAGQPDFGLYSGTQIQKHGDQIPIAGQIPERGVVEAKPLDDDSWVTAKGKQVSKYWGHYGQVLVTNYRDFVLIGDDSNGKPSKKEVFRLASSEENFWRLAKKPNLTSTQIGHDFDDFLRRTLLSRAPISRPEDLAWLLASYAKQARAKVEGAGSLTGIQALKEALENSLGMSFEGPKGRHFFNATLVQTLFYGLFAAWVLWARDKKASDSSKFNWHDTAYGLRVPMISSLYYQVADPTKLKKLGLRSIMDWAEDCLNRVVLDEFFSSFDEDHAIQYFYEPFLRTYDPELRKELGVWYTPNEIVKFQVAQINNALRDDLGIDDGFADPSVYVLDPCCGTGTYLLEILNQIARTYSQKGVGALLGQRLKEAAISRIFGFEIIPAPFVVSHLQLGLLLKKHGASLDNDDERLGVYLTNSLTGWASDDSTPGDLPWPELAFERDASKEIKTNVPILVILGNPPYNAFAGVSTEAEGGLVNKYKEGLIADWGIRKFNLDDLYIRFFGVAENRIVENGRGIVSFISNFSYLSDPSFVVMRQRLTSEFDEIRIDCLNGDSRETGKKTPDGMPDPSVFSTEHNKAGIRVETAIGFFLKKQAGSTTTSVTFYRDFWGAEKRKELLDSIGQEETNKYQEIFPRMENRYSLRLLTSDADYEAWSKVTDLANVSPFPAFMESRRNGLIAMDRKTIKQRMRRYFDPELKWAEILKEGHGLTQDAATFDAKKARQEAINVESFDDSKIQRYLVRPFDLRWCYFTQVPGLWHRSRPSLAAQIWPENRYLITRMSTEKNAKGSPILSSEHMASCQALARNVSMIPFTLKPEATDSSAHSHHMFAEDGDEVANISAQTRKYLAELGNAGLTELESADLIWYHVTAIGLSVDYWANNRDAMRHDWPRCPLPDSLEALQDSAELGRQVTECLTPGSKIDGVTSGEIWPGIVTIGTIACVSNGTLDPTKGDLRVTASWGRIANKGAVMPGRGKVLTRDYTKTERDALAKLAPKLGLDNARVCELLGQETCDVFLNDNAYWKNVPAEVWDFHIGGFQVIKKWLSYREFAITGQDLSVDDAEHITETARRLAVLALLQDRLNHNYSNCCDHSTSIEEPVSS